MGEESQSSHRHRLRHHHQRHHHHHILKQGERFINKLGADKHSREEEEEALNPMLFQLPSSHDGRAHYLRQSLSLFISNFFWSTFRENSRKLHVMSSGAVTMGRNALPRVLSRLLTLGEGGPAYLCSHSCLVGEPGSSHALSEDKGAVASCPLF